MATANRNDDAAYDMKWNEQKKNVQVHTVHIYQGEGPVALVMESAASPTSLRQYKQRRRSNGLVVQ